MTSCPCLIACSPSSKTCVRSCWNSVEMLKWVLRESGGEQVQVIHIGTALLRRSDLLPNKLSVPPEHNNEFRRGLVRSFVVEIWWAEGAKQSLMCVT